MPHLVVEEMGILQILESEWRMTTVIDLMSFTASVGIDVRWSCALTRLLSCLQDCLVVEDGTGV